MSDPTLPVDCAMTVREASGKIDRLRAELAEKDDVIFCFEAELKTANARIAELEAEHNKQVCLRCMHAPGGFVTEEQINAAWEYVTHTNNRIASRQVECALAKLGIVACEKCGGSGVVSSPYELDAEDCPDCNGHGWVWRSDG